MVNLNNPNIPLVGGSAEPEPVPALDSVMRMQSKAVELLWERMTAAEYGGSDWIAFAKKFARHIIGLEVTGGLAESARAMETHTPAGGAT